MESIVPLIKIKQGLINKNPKGKQRLAGRCYTNWLRFWNRRMINLNIYIYSFLDINWFIQNEIWIICKKLLILLFEYASNFFLFFRFGIIFMNSSGISENWNII